jgi:fatty-acyl-CoA synthase
VILQRDGRAVPADGRAGREVTSVGRPVPETEVAIADASGGHLEERRVGEILVRSGSLMRGYRGQTEPAIRDGWLSTGDLGYVADGELYITGRAKELIIVGGANYFPDDLERQAGAVDGVRQGRAVAFSVDDSERAGESVVVLVETTLRDPARRASLEQAVRRSLTAAGLPVNVVGLAPPRFIRSTDTGKVKRVEARQRYLAGELDGAS